MRDAKDDEKAISILREHYMLSGKPKVIFLYTELTTLSKGENKSMTDCTLRAEVAVAALKNDVEEVSNAFLIAMILKGTSTRIQSF